MWELAVVGCLVLFIAGLAMRKTKIISEFASFSSRNTVSEDELASKIAKQVSEEIGSILKELKNDLKALTVNTTSSPVRPSSDNLHVESIKIDESIIPTNLTVDVESINLDTATKEEKVIDKGLEKSKSKLAALRKQRKI